MVDRAGYDAMQSGMQCTLRDFARWGQMLCDKGKTGNKQSIPGVRELVEDIQENANPALWTEMSALKSGFPAGTAYRSHLFALAPQDGRSRVIASVGGYNQNCLVDVDQRIVVAQVGSYWFKAPDKLKRKDPPAGNYVALQYFMNEVLPDLVRKR
jgi:CubicO group peptidase (beta-lactamase class C family)